MTNTVHGSAGRATRVLLGLMVVALSIGGSPLARPAAAATGLETTMSVGSDKNPGQAGVKITAVVTSDSGETAPGPCLAAPPVAVQIAGKVVFTDTGTGVKLGEAPVGNHRVTHCESNGAVGFYNVAADASITVTFPISQLGTSRLIKAELVPTDLNHFAPSSATYHQTVAYSGLETTMSVGSDKNPGQAGVKITAVVTSDSGGTAPGPCLAAPPVAVQIAGKVVFTDTGTGVKLGEAPVGNHRVTHCESNGAVGFYNVAADASITVTFPISQLGTSRLIKAELVPTDLNHFAPSSATYHQTVAYSGLETTMSVGSDKNPGQAGVKITAVVTSDSGGTAPGPCLAAPPVAVQIAGKVVFTDTGTGVKLGEAPVGNHRVTHCESNGAVGFYNVAADASITVTFPISQLGTSRLIKAELVPTDLNHFAPSSATYHQTVAYSGLETTTVVSASPNPGQAGVKITAVVTSANGETAPGPCLAAPPVAVQVAGKVVFTDVSAAVKLGEAPVGNHRVTHCESNGAVGFYNVAADASITVTFPAGQVGTTSFVKAEFIPTDVNDLAPSTGTYNQKVAFTGVGTTTSVSASPNPGLAGVKITAVVARASTVIGPSPCPVTPPAANQILGKVVFTDVSAGGVKLGEAPVGNPRVVGCMTGGPQATYGISGDAAITVSFPVDQLGTGHQIKAEFVSTDLNRYFPSSGTYNQVIQGKSLTLTSDRNPASPGAPVTLTARWDECVPGLLFLPMRRQGTVSIVDTSTGATLGSTFVTQAACQSPTTVLTVTTSSLASGLHKIAARFTLFGAVNPDVTTNLDQVITGLDSKITVSGVIVRSAGQTVIGTATNFGGPGVYGIVVAYRNVATGVVGFQVATCTGCGAGGTSVTWKTNLAALPAGYYQFAAQPVSMDGTVGPASNVANITLV